MLRPEQQASAEVAEAVSRRREPVDLLRLRHVRQQAVVADNAPDDSNIAQQYQRAPELPVALPNEEHAGRRDHTQGEKRAEELLARPRIIGDRAGGRCDQGHDHHAQRGDQAVLPRRDALAKLGPHGLVEVDREDRCDDDREVGRIGPVIKRPGSSVAAVDPEPSEDAGHRAES